MTPKRFLPATVILAALAGPALAGPQYVNESGFANAGYDVVAYFDMEQAPVGGAQPPAIPGRQEFTATYNGARFAFATADNLARFQADPARYAPLYDGHCAFGVARGYKVPANPNVWRIVDGRLNLNYSPEVGEEWASDIPGYVRRSEENWGDLDDTPASSDPIPSFDAAAAPAR